MPVDSRREFGSRRRRLRALAGDVDRDQCAAALQHRGEVGAVRRLPGLGHRPSAERPAGGAGGDRLLLRRAARGHCGLRHAGRDHLVAPDPRRVRGARGAGLRAHLQHRPCGVRRTRRAGDGARSGDRTAGDRARRDDRPPVAGDRVVPAFLRHGVLWRDAFGQGDLAGAARRGRQLCDQPVRRLEPARLFADRRPRLARIADRHAAVPAGLEAQAGSRIRDSRRDARG